MPLTRAQYIQGDSGKGQVLVGQVQGVKQGAGTIIAPDGTISFYPETAVGVVKLNNSTAYNQYVWPQAKGASGTFLGVNNSGNLEWLPAPGLVTLGGAPANPRLGQLWFSYATNLTYVFQNREGTDAWYPVYRGLEAEASLCTSSPPFELGDGSETDPFQMGSITSSSGNTVLFPSTVTITGLAPFQYLPIVDVNTEINDYRFQVTNSFADYSGTLSFKLKYTDYPQTLPGTSYTARLRLGFNSPFFIVASMGITSPLAIESSGSISGEPIIGQVLTYTQGNAVGGTPPYIYTWVWKSESAGAVLQNNGSTYDIGSGVFEDRVYVQLIATDSALDSASGNTSSIPSPPNLVGKGPFPYTNILYPISLTGTASTAWLDAGTSLRASGCIEFSVDGISFGQGPTTIANGATITTRWIDSPSCGGADNSVTIYGCIYSSSYQDCESFHIDRIPSPFSFPPVSGVARSTVASSSAIVPIGYNSTAYVSYNGVSTGSSIQGSLNGGSWANLPLVGSTAFPIYPGDSLRVRMTVGADFETGYTAVVNIGQGSTVQSATFTATTELSTSFTTSIAFPNTTTEEVASPSWFDGSTSLSVTGCLEFKVGSGGTWMSPGDAPTAITNGAILYTRWSNATPGVCGNAPHGTPLTGTITNVPSGGTKVSTGSLTIDRAPDFFSFINLTGQALSSVIESNTVNIVGTNAPAFLTYDGSSTLTSLQARVGGGSWTGIPSSGETLSIAPVSSGPGTTLQIRGTTGSSQNQTYSATVNAGQSTSIQSTTWGVTTLTVIPSIVTPGVVSPVNGATNVNPNLLIPPGVSITASAYTPLNGAGSHISSDWEIYYLSGGTPVYVVQSNNDTINLTSYVVPLTSLGASSTFYVRVRYRTTTPSTIVSGWSNVSQFTIVIPSVSTPSILSPVNGSANLDPNLNSPSGITLTSSAYSPQGGAGTHASTNWEVRKNSTGGTVVVNTNSSTSKTSYFLTTALLETSSSYYCRCQYVSAGPNPVTSPWSSWSLFSTASFFTCNNWFVTMGAEDTDRAYSVKFDTSGNVYVCGQMFLTSSVEAVVAKFNQFGQIQWQRALGYTAFDSGVSLALDSTGNVYVSGVSYSSPGSAFIAKYNNSGSLQWQRYIGDGGAIDVAYGITVDSDSNLCMVGVLNAGLGSVILLAKYSSSGTLLWQRTLGGAGSISGGSGIKTDSSNNIYITGQTDLNSDGYGEMYTVKLNLSGSIVWQKSLGGVSSGQSAGGGGITLDSSGNVYVTGMVIGQGSGDSDLLLVKYNNLGVLQWQKYLGGSGYDSGFDLVTDSSNNVYVVGGTRTSPGGTPPYIQNLLIVKYNSSGVLQWQRVINSQASVQGGPGGIAYDLYNTGTDFCVAGSILAGVTDDWLIAKLPTDGSKTGTYGGITYSVSSLTGGNTTLVDSTGSLVVSASSIPNGVASLTGGSPSVPTTIISTCNVPP